MEELIGTEAVVHGRQWGTLHGGYFADSAGARPLVEAVVAVLEKSPADVVVDLGGGTGFLLSQLQARGVGAATVLLNVDCSEVQLALSDEAGIASVCTPVGSFRRADAAPEGGRVCFLMRSLLHYFGEDGLTPILRYLREQAADGECFVHQTASFADAAEAACLNALYRYMRIGKWYPTADELGRRLADSGWRVTDISPAPTLVLTSEDLARRYALDAADLASIGDLMVREFGPENGVFRVTPSGFEADLHYRIFSCLAAPVC
jgi:hypothetical protein